MLSLEVKMWDRERERKSVCAVSGSQNGENERVLSLEVKM